MSDFVHFREMPASVPGFVREAIKALGYFRSDRADQLIALFADIWPKGLSADVLLRHYEAITPLLSSKGLSNPRHAARATTLRVIFNQQRHEAKELFSDHPYLSATVTFRARGDACCSRSREMDGNVSLLSDRTDLPLPGCNAEWCPCRWDGNADGL